MLSRLIRTVTLAITFALTGCAATVTKSSLYEPSLEISASAKKAVVMQVQAAPGMPAASNWDVLRTDWRNGIAVAAGKADMRTTWADGDLAPTEEPAVLVVIKVRNYRYMDTGTRIALGIMAGQAYVNAEIEFYELPSKKLLGRRVYGTTTKLHEGIFSASPKEQIYAMSEEIIGEIRR